MVTGDIEIWEDFRNSNHGKQKTELDWSGTKVAGTTGFEESSLHYGCFTLPKKTLSTIVESGNDYLVVVKGNQKTLPQQIHSHTNLTTPTRQFQQTETTRDRLIHRTIEVFTPPAEIDSN